ncbi:hypothetical protein FPZ43_06900 [Mucilaginibacter pallidiroseus]|uniref:EcsC family protein n=1 Tax=Mucilaginibacter pallidiroseus TaxID=2599295 RepID=A0A563UH70_9SPHI|nr:hypothetical protein [Mucilaginibacter pallidiroseus]TWR30656.1 hypothetical protein FPZ43_06900 [Mucilaginibacter pallidiroseus]
MLVPFKKARVSIKEFTEKLSTDGFRNIFNNIDQLSIKKGVDTMGLDKFINQCAYIAAGTGAIAGTGGVLTMIVGMPVDFVNLITQQFRVTMAIMYYNKGSYRIGFDDFMSLVATSFKIEAGVAVSKTMMESIAEKLLLAFGVRTAERLIPVVGAVIGGTTNYIFVKRMAEKVKELYPDPKKIIKID